MRKIFLMLLCLSLLAIPVTSLARDCTVKANTRLLKVDWSNNGSLAIVSPKNDMIITVGEHIKPDLASELNSIKGLSEHDWTNASWASIDNGTMDSVKTFIVREDQIFNCSETPDPFPKEESSSSTGDDYVDDVLGKCQRKCQWDANPDTCIGACMMFGVW